MKTKEKTKHTDYLSTKHGRWSKVTPWCLHVSCQPYQTLRPQNPSSHICLWLLPQIPEETHQALWMERASRLVHKTSDMWCAVVFVIMVVVVVVVFFVVKMSILIIGGSFFTLLRKETVFPFRTKNYWRKDSSKWCVLHNIHLSVITLHVL